jgi:hypothetical protein
LSKALPRPRSILCWILLPGLALAAGPEQSSHDSAFRLLLSEVRPGGMATDQRCTLIFADHRFHHETASSKLGRELARKVYEGELSGADWNALAGILDRKEFHDLAVPRIAPPPVMPDLHIYTISVARDGTFQNLEFLTDKSRKPYDSELKPLLQWWKSFYGRRMPESHAPPDGHCSPDNNNALFTE